MPLRPATNVGSFLRRDIVATNGASAMTRDHSARAIGHVGVMPSRSSGLATFVLDIGKSRTNRVLPGTATDNHCIRPGAACARQSSVISVVHDGSFQTCACTSGYSNGERRQCIARLREPSATDHALIHNGSSIRRIETTGARFLPAAGADPRTPKSTCATRRHLSLGETATTCLLPKASADPQGIEMPKESVIQ